MKHVYSLLIITLNMLFAGSSYSQPGGTNCNAATYLNMPDTVYPYYSDSGWFVQGFHVQSSPAWFKIKVPAGKPISGFMVRGGAAGYCSTTNKLLYLGVYKDSCSSGTPLLQANLNSCMNTGSAHSNWNELRQTAVINNVSAGDSFYLSVSGATTLGYGISVKWIDQLPGNDTCTRTDTITHAETYGSNYNPGVSSSEFQMPPCQSFTFPGQLMMHHEVLNPVFYTFIPTKDTFTINIQPLASDGYPIIRLAVFKDCAHMGDYTQNPSGNYEYFYGCSDTSGITITNAPVGIPLILRVDPHQALSGDFNLSTSNLSIYKITATGILMPASISNFSALYRQSSHKVDLQWSITASAAGTFIIERSDDGIRFYAIGAIRSSPVNRDYSYVDEKSLTGKIYYRLKVEDADGKHSYSRIAMVDPAKRSRVSVYPNPAHDVVNIVVESRVRQRTEVVMINAEGKTILRKRVELVAGYERVKNRV